MYDGLSAVHEFQNRYQKEGSKQQRFNTLKWVLHATPARWWDTHQRSFGNWCDYRRMIRMQFGKPQMWLKDKIVEQNGLRAHLSRWM